MLIIHQNDLINLFHCGSAVYSEEDRNENEINCTATLEQ